METAVFETGRDGFADTSRRFVTQYHRRQHRFAIGGLSLGEAQGSGGQRRAGMHDSAQIAIVQKRRRR